MELAFMFSGQGSEYVNMCRDLYEEYDSIKERFDKASEFLGYDVKEILFYDEEKLKDTRYTQVLLFLMYVSIRDLLKEFSIESSHSFGLSLGEYGALYDSGVLSFEDGLGLLEKRGECMKEACANTSGAMSAILGMEAKELELILADIEGYVVIANYNSYGQLVISGEVEAVKEASIRAKAAGAKRCILLPVMGAFHSDLMKGAANCFHHHVKEYNFQKPQKHLLLNTSGTYYSGSIQEELEKHISHSVYFYQMVEECIKDNVTSFVEIGPKRSLCALVKKINKNVKIMNVENLESLHKTLESLVQE